MIVQKLISSQKKPIAQKQPYKKPVYKSYRELLQLDRPKKNISYESSSSEEDFLEKLLKEEKKKTKSKKKTSRKNTSHNQKRSRGQKRQIVVTSKKEEEQEEKKKVKSKVMNEIQLFLAQTKDLQGSEQKNPEKGQASAQLPKEPRTAKSKSKSMVRIKAFSNSQQKSKLKKQDVLLSNPIFIDTKSIETPPIFYTSASKMLTTTIPTKQKSAHQELLLQKARYLQQFQKPSSSLMTHLQKESIHHQFKAQLNKNFSFNPSIDPLYANWRMHLTFNPLENQPKRQFKDRKTLFKNKVQQQRFVESLRQLSKIKR